MKIKEFIPFFKPVGLDQKINFGKHKGLTVKQICEKDVDWIAWAIENLKMHLDTWAFDYYMSCCETEFENSYGVSKPHISDKQFKQACERIEKGELDLIQKVKDHFTLADTQLKLLDLYEITKHLRP
jgi:hypothetical protein